MVTFGYNFKDTGDSGNAFPGGSGIVVSITFIAAAVVAEPSAPTPRSPSIPGAAVPDAVQGPLKALLASTAGFNFGIAEVGPSNTLDKVTDPAFSIGQATGAQDNVLNNAAVIFGGSGLFP
jgi:hypothetical protein